MTYGLVVIHPDELVRVKAAEILVGLPELRAFNPDQARDEKGRFAPGDGDDDGGSGDWRSGFQDAASGVADVAASPLTDVTALGGGWSASTKIEDHEAGRLVRKDFPPHDDIRAPQDQADAERLGSLTASAMGVNAPAVIADGSDSVLMEHVPGQTWAESHPYSGRLPGEIADSDQGRLIGLYDIVTGNPDRNMGNFMVDEHGRLVAIDQSLAFSHRWAAGVGSPFAGHYANEAGNNWADTFDISARDMGIIRERLEGLRDDFEASGRGAWHKLMMERLAALEPRATGSRDRLS